MIEFLVKERPWAWSGDPSFQKLKFGEMKCILRDFPKSFIFFNVPMFQRREDGAGVERIEMRKKLYSLEFEFIASSKTFSSKTIWNVCGFVILCQ